MPSRALTRFCSRQRRRLPGATRFILCCCAHPSTDSRRFRVCPWSTTLARLESPSLTTCGLSVMRLSMVERWHAGGQALLSSRISRACTDGQGQWSQAFAPLNASTSVSQSHGFAHSSETSGGASICTAGRIRPRTWL